MIHTTQKIKISILVDNQNSWIVPCLGELISLIPAKYKLIIVYKHKDVPKGEILFLIGCTRIISKKTLSLNKHNIVIHESDLPKGKGWSPVSWQILEGENRIPIVVFEATEELDAGDIYLKDYIYLDGTELYEEIKNKQGKKTISLILKFLEKYPNIIAIPQANIPETYYERRSTKNDQLDINKSIKENFNLLRIVNNERYPAWFEYKGTKYIVKIYKDN